MKTDKLIDAIGMIDDDYIEEAHSPKKKSSLWNRELILKLATGAVCILLAVTVIPQFFRSADSGGAANGSYMAYDQSAKASDEEGYAYPSYEAMEAEIPNPSSLPQDRSSNQKLILTADLEMETQDLDEMTSSLLQKVKAYGGYVQTSSFYNRSESTRIYSATIRIPSSSYESFLEEVKGSGNTIRYNETVDDVTDSYTDTEARLSSLRAQYDKVLEFYDKAEDISDLMSVEQRLSDLQYEIEYLEARIKNYDLLISYSTLNLSVTETKVYTPVKTDFFSRLGRTFLNGWNHFTVGIESFILDVVYNIWTILILTAIAFVGYRVYRRIRRKKA